MQERVTILIANRDYGRYLGDAIDSALQQTYKNINVVVVDDGSTDDSWDVIHNKLFKDKAHNKLSLDGDIVVKVATQDNMQLWAAKLPDVNGLGPSIARNFAIDRWITQCHAFQILDADDIMHPEKVRILLSKMLTSPSIGVVYADYDNWNIDTDIKTREYKEPFDKHRLFQECIVHSGSMISSAALATVKRDGQYYRNSMRTAEDWMMWLMVSQRFMISHVPLSLTNVRVHKENSTFSVDKNIWNQNWSKIQYYINTGNLV